MKPFTPGIFTKEMGPPHRSLPLCSGCRLYQKAFKKIIFFTTVLYLQNYYRDTRNISRMTLEGLKSLSFVFIYS